MREYESCFALLIRDFIAYRKASGRWNEASYGPNLRVFDRFCAMNYPDSVHPTQEMVDDGADSVTVKQTIPAGHGYMSSTVL
ncbi:MAG: hypothetical protein ACLR0U_28275 [Enterocloster clostridioformis]